MPRNPGHLRLLSLLAALSVACAPQPDPSVADPATAIGELLDGWHRAASVADEAAYFDGFSRDAVFLGTDAAERWDVESFREYAHPHFAAGRGWTYRPADRHVALSAEGTLGWFDERLRSEKYGDLRGSGVVRLERGRWKLVQYNMTFTVPNEVAGAVVHVIRGDPN